MFPSVPVSLSDTGKNAYNSKPVDVSFDVVATGHKKRYIPSASSAMVIGGILGFIQAIFLISGAKPLLNFMGVSSVSSFCQDNKIALEFIRCKRNVGLIFSFTKS